MDQAATEDFWRKYEEASIFQSNDGRAFFTLLAACAWASPQARPAAKKTANSTAHKATAAQRSSASLLNPASFKLQAPAVFSAKFTTTKGDFVVEVTRAWSPRGADRFYNLVKYHFFDGASFFRVMQGFVAQFGVSPRPDVTRAWENTTIPDDAVTQSNTRGTLTFATAGPTLARRRSSSISATTPISMPADSLPLARSSAAWKWSTSSIASMETGPTRRSRS